MGSRQPCDKASDFGLYLATVAAHDAFDDALHLAELDADRVEGGISWLKANVVVFLEEGFERGRAIGQERDNAVAIHRDLGAFDEDVIAIENTFVAHRVAFDFEGKGRIAS